MKSWCFEPMGSLLRHFLLLILGPVAIWSGLAFASPEEQKANSSQRSRLETRQSREKQRSLAQIQSLKVNLQEFKSVEKPLDDVRKLSEIVNPFRVRKRGRFYGSVYAFHRNDNFDARNFFDSVGTALPEFKRNQFGGTFGAFLNERLTLFATFDGLRINRGLTVLSKIPLPEMLAGDFSALNTQLTNPFSGEVFLGNRIPKSMINPVFSRLAPLIPMPNREDPDRNFVNNQPFIRDSNSISGRVDYEFSQDSKLFGNYSFHDQDVVGVRPLPAFQTSRQERDRDFSLNYTNTLRPNWVSSLRVAFYRDAIQQLSESANQPGLLESIGIQGLSVEDGLEEGVPFMLISGYADLGLAPGDSPLTSFRNRLDLKAHFTYVVGGHRLSFGLERTYKQINNRRSGGLRRGQFFFSGSRTGDGVADFLLGLPDTATRALGADRRDLRQRWWKFFVRDDWKISSNFSLSASLGYNYFAPFTSIHNDVSGFVPLLFEPPSSGEIVVFGSQRSGELGLNLSQGQAIFPDNNDFEPSLGLAYSPFGNNRLVVRALYRIHYDPIREWHYLSVLGRNYPFFYAQTADSPPGSPLLDLSSPFDSSTPTELSVAGFDPHTKNTYVQAWRLSLEQEFLKLWNLEIAYQGRKATNSVHPIPGNVPLPGSELIQPRRPNPGFGQYRLFSSRGSSSGHSLLLSLGKRFSEGLSIRSDFTWNRTWSDLGGSSPNNPRNLRSERALSAFVNAKRLMLHYIYDLPVGPDRMLPASWAGKLSWMLEGWRFSGVTRMLSGRPLNVRLATDFNNDGLRSDRPDRIGSGVLSGERSIDRYFAIEDFRLPSDTLGFGNAGRNVLIAPGEQVWDISIIKRTPVSGDGDLLEFRVQLFNAFNRANFRNPGTVVDTALFGKISGAKQAREIEIGLKYSF